MNLSLSFYFLLIIGFVNHIFYESLDIFSLTIHSLHWNNCLLFCDLDGLVLEINNLALDLNSLLFYEAKVTYCSFYYIDLRIEDLCYYHLVLMSLTVIYMTLNLNSLFFLEKLIHRSFILFHNSFLNLIIYKLIMDFLHYLFFSNLFHMCMPF